MRISDWSSDVCSSDLFGQVLALGLGAAVISSADLPGVDKMQLGQAFVSDVLGEGEGGALMNTLISASQGGGGGDSLFSGGMSFEAPGLDGLLGGLAQQALGAPHPSGAPPSNSPPSHSIGRPSRREIEGQYV